MSLIPLPLHFDELLGALGGTKCKGCGKRPSDPALCLLCGALLCGASACCRHKPRDRHMFGRSTVLNSGSIGECTAHASLCSGSGASLMLFLSGRRSTDVLLLAPGGASCFAGASPYVDVHGEQDLGLKRGRPLMLSAARYGQLTELWASGGIAREVFSNRLLTNQPVNIHGVY